MSLSFMHLFLPEAFTAFISPASLLKSKKNNLTYTIVCTYVYTNVYMKSNILCELYISELISVHKR